MNEELDRRQNKSGWFKDQVTFGNIVVIVMFIGAIVSWQRTTETTNQVQDIKIDAVTKRMDAADQTYQRRDLSDQKLEGITEQLRALSVKIDNISRAVR